MPALDLSVDTARVRCLTVYGCHSSSSSSAFCLLCSLLLLSWLSARSRVRLRSRQDQEVRFEHVGV